MRKILPTLVVFVAVSASVAFADNDDCFVPMADWQPREAVVQFVAEKDWLVRRIKIDDGCYKIYGRDAEGHQIEVTIHPQTLQVLELEYEDENENEKEKEHKVKGHD